MTKNHARFLVDGEPFWRVRDRIDGSSACSSDRKDLRSDGVDLVLDAWGVDHGTAPSRGPWYGWRIGTPLRGILGAFNSGGCYELVVGRVERGAFASAATPTTRRGSGALRALVSTKPKKLPARRSPSSTTKWCPVSPVSGVSDVGRVGLRRRFPTRGEIVAGASVRAPLG